MAMDTLWSICTSRH